MGHLTRKDVAMLMEAAQQLYADTASPDYPYRVNWVLSHLIPWDHSIIASTDCKEKTGIVAGFPFGALPPQFFNTFVQFMHQHPAYPPPLFGQPMSPATFGKRPEVRKEFLRVAAEGRVGRVSDAMSRKRLTKLEFYNEAFRPNGIEYQMGAHFFRNGSRVDSLAISRSFRDFSERERQMLELIIPFVKRGFSFNRAFAPPQGRIAQWEEAAGSKGLGIIAVGLGGAIRHSTENGLKYIARHFRPPAGGGFLPEALRRWFAEQMKFFAADHDLGDLKPFIAERPGCRFVAHIGAFQPGGDALVFIEEMTAAHGLTGRELEVLQWAAQGKTNADIAAILGVRPPTVKKHLEHIYLKLGVENRLSAALALAEMTKGSATP